MMAARSVGVSEAMLSDLLAGVLPPAAIPAEASVPVSGLQLDSRRLRPGDVFFAYPGAHQDGRDFLAAAAGAGAAAIVAETGVSAAQLRAAGQVPVVEIDSLARCVGAIAASFYDNPSDDMLTVGITGTNGKTTTSRVLAQLLRHALDSCGVIGTLGATLGNDTLEAGNTTPDAISLQAQLADWRDQDVRAAVMEVSSHSLAQGRVTGTHYNTAVFTNLTHDHLDYHGDMERYGLAKSLLFQSPGLESAVINRDDPYAEKLIEVLAPGVRLVDYSLTDSAAAVSAGAIEYHDSGLETRVSTPWGEGVLHSPLAGDFNLANLLAAISAACLAGMPLSRALAAVATLEGVDGRMQYVANPLGIQLVVDYAHTPDALAKALSALRAHTRGRLHCVFGCGGDRDREKRAVMGRIAIEHADRVIVTSDNPRGEEPMAIIEDILEATGPGADVAADRADAITLAVQSARPGDCVLVAGKGHESYQEIQGRRLPFSDVAQLRRALEARS